VLAAPDAEGRITAPLGDGRLAAVARGDLADIAARVVAGASTHTGCVYELVGEEAIGGADLARALSAAGTAHVSYEPATLALTREALAASGAAPFQVPMLVTTFSAIAGGFMSDTRSDLAERLGRAPRRALDIITAAASTPPR
jgi:NAD(P)H dehydrogenase (quinone)